MDTLHLSNEQVAFGEESSNGKLVSCRPFTEDTAREIDGREWKVSEKGGGKVDFPSLRLDFHYSTDHEIAYFWGVAGS